MIRILLYALAAFLLAGMAFQCQAGSPPCDDRSALPWVACK